MDIEKALEFDELKKFEYDGMNAFIHKDHRWSLCLLCLAQEQDWVPRPCDLILFDRHHDGLRPRELSQIQKVRNEGITFESTFRLCSEVLSTLDDDWIIAGMELGLIRDCVIFGVHDMHSLDLPDRQFSDYFGDSHSFRILGMPRGELGYQGDLSDRIKSMELEPIWKILRWKYSTEIHQFSFVNNGEPIWVDFDLDVFAIRWSEYIIPWNDEIFCTEFSTNSSYSTTIGWSGREFVSGLLKQAGLFTIATEPSHCGGVNNMKEILERFNRHVFREALRFSS